LLNMIEQVQHLEEPVDSATLAAAVQMKDLGYGKGYQYDPDTGAGFSGADYFPPWHTPTDLLRTDRQRIRTRHRRTPQAVGATTHRPQALLPPITLQPREPTELRERTHL
ncbi:hypothetical protein, partial [Arthrobacter sp. ISL-95]|uniref:hypothetical protein n=1 Tax=Arthrobacter sp. ISL-95 TaxID=2819116 RepID=UPI001BEAE801